MNALRKFRPGTLGVSLLAGLTTWVTLLAWTGFAEKPFGYLGPLAGACLVVAVVGTLLRSVRVPAAVVALAQLVLLLLWMQHGWARSEALGGVLPTPASLRGLADVVSVASTTAQQFAAPVPASADAFYPLLIVAGSCTAVLVDFLAVGLRRVPLAGLPLLAAYTAPVSILDGGVSWFTFALAALCFVFLIAAVEGGRLTHWGRQLTPGSGLFDIRSAPVGSGGVWTSARRIGFTATALAVVVPVLLPSFSGSLFGGGSGGGDGDGDAVSISNPMVDLKRDLVRGVDIDLVRVRTREPDPSYLRITVLNSFDGQAWRPADRDIPVQQRAEGRMPLPEGLLADVPAKEYSAELAVSEDFATRWLPLPYPPVAVEAEGDWRYDRSTLDFVSASDDDTAAGLSYRVRSLAVRPTAAQLAEAPSAPLSVSQANTALPKGFPAGVEKLARSLTTDDQSKFEKAVALQQWFRVDGGFRYSLERSAGNGTDDLVDFLGNGPDGRVGYCEQFAAAMAVMGRTLGIPSRVAVGFLRPEQEDGEYVYSSHDLHSWPEMYFSGVGWVRFEPTPQRRTGGGLPSYTTQQVPQAAPSASASSGAAAVRSADRVAPTANADAAGATAGGGSSSRGPWLFGGLAAVVLLGLLVLVPRSLRSAVRRRRWDAADDPRGWVEAGWQEIRDTARDLGIPWNDRVTLRTTAAAVEQSLGDPSSPESSSPRPPHGPEVNPAAGEALHRMVGLLERARYARTLPADAATAESVATDVSTCVEALRAGAGRRRATRATWLPRSLTGSLRRPSARTAAAGRRVGGPGIDRAV